MKPLRNRVHNEEIDYLMLKSLLAGYAQPRAKISALLKSGELIRIKKGLYIFGKDTAHHPYSKEHLANLIYAPSCLSLEYALAFHDMIPERVETVTNITPRRDKTFNTPVGRFTYRYLNAKKYSIGIALHEIMLGKNILIASPEKALADKIILSSPDLSITSESDIEHFLFQDLRFYTEKATSLDAHLLKELSEHYRNKNLTEIFNYLIKRNNKNA